MTITPTPEIIEIGQEEAVEFRDKHLPEELNDLLIKHFTVSTLNAFKIYILENNNVESNKRRKFSSYITKLKNFYKTTFFNRQNMVNTFLDLYSFCNENPELANEFAVLLSENINGFIKSLKEG